MVGYLAKRKLGLFRIIGPRLRCLSFPAFFPQIGFVSRFTLPTSHSKLFQLALFVQRFSNRLLTTDYCLLALFGPNLHHGGTEDTEKARE
jgi:hypothetical protein